MKNYFKFNLTGQILLPVWLLFLVLFVIPYGFVQYKMNSFQNIQKGNPAESLQALGSIFKLYGVMLVLAVVEYVFFYFIGKIIIRGIAYNGKQFSFEGQFGKFFGIVVSGFLLTIITLGIYSPWYITKMYHFFTKNTNCDSSDFTFKGKGSDLFVIITCTLIIPLVIIGIVAGITGFFMAAARGSVSPAMTGQHSVMYTVLFFLAIIILMIPYIYYVYNWMANIKYKNYDIQWETGFWSSSAKIAQEIFLSIITVGIYSPLAGLKLYSYFSERTIARSETVTKKFGYDIEPMKDFLFIWGQNLLGIITLGIYYPWAFCKIYNRILGKTYSEVIETAE